MTDVELLAMHRRGDESAFADLVRRHMGWVHGLARRRLHDAHLAQDIAQAVFVLLHRKGPALGSDGALLGWLHRAAWYASENAARRQRRLRRRETEAAAMKTASIEEPSAEWRELAPLLDELVGRLSRAEREVILLRYYRDLSLAEVGEQIGVSADAARKRIDRAVEKLRSLAGARGVTVSAAALPGLLAAHVRVPPPPGLVATATVAASAPAGSPLAISANAILKGAVLAMSGTKLTIAAGALLAALLIAGGAAVLTAWLTSGQTRVVVIAALPPAASSPITAVPFPRRLAFPPDVWTPSPFQAIRWPSPTPQVQVNGTWYELSAVNGVSVDRIVRFIVQQNKAPVSCYQFQFESDLLNDVNLIRGVAGGFDTATLDVKDLTTGQVQTLRDVPATATNRRTLLAARQDAAQAPDSAKAFLHQALTYTRGNKTDDLIVCFTPLDAAQHDRLLSSVAYPAKCLEINDEIAAKFSHDAVGAADHFFKPFWWLDSLNEFDSPGAAVIDLRSIGLGQMSMHKTDGAWKIDAAWISDNADGLDRIAGFLPQLLQFESRFQHGRYTSGQEVAHGIQTLSMQFGAAIARR